MDLKQLSDDIRCKSQSLAEIVGACKYLLKNLSEAKFADQYINSRISEYSKNKFGLGFFPQNDSLNKLFSIVDKKLLEDLSIVYNKYASEKGCVRTFDSGHFNFHNIVIPYKDEYGNIIGLVGRSSLTEEGRSKFKLSKYKYSTFNKSLHLFGLYQAKKSIIKNKFVILVEGQFDCINCHGHGFNNTVALGGSSLNLFQMFLLKKYTNNIYLLLDNDDAGRKGEEKIIKKYSNYININKLRLPDRYKDVDEYLKSSKDFNIFDI